MFTKEALEHLESKLSAQNVPALDCAALVPDNHSLISIEQYQDYRFRYRGVLQTDSLKGFSDYVNSSKSSGDKSGLDDDDEKDQTKLFVNKKDMMAKAFFNLGTNDLPGHGDHFALLTMKPRAEYKAAIEMNGAKPNQRTLAEWFEDYADYIVAHDSDGAEMTAVQAAYAVRNLNLETLSNLESTLGNTGHTVSMMDKVEAKSKGRIPTEITFTCVPYDGMGEKLIRMRLVTAGAKDESLFRLRIVGFELLEEAIAEDFCKLLEEKTEIKPIIGWFNP
jgi:uncharacterized protein YfdQ (DUF2303 family)